MHHAHDAYLNIVVGNVYNTKFTNDPRRFVKDYELDKLTNNYHLSKMFNYDVMRNGYCAWRAGENGTISTVKRMLAKPSPMLTRMSFVGHGQISNQGIRSIGICLDGNAQITVHCTGVAYPGLELIVNTVCRYRCV